MHPTNTTHIPKQETDTFEISPTLEMEHPASLSTHWIPLDELIALWTDRDLLLSRTPMAALLAAIGHALLALARESRALQRYTLAWQRREDAPALQRVRRLARVARSQQQRLWALTTEVHTQVQEWRSTRQGSQQGEVR